MTAFETTQNSVPSWFEAGMPPRERCVLSALLEATARADPQRVFAKFEDGSRWSYAQALQLSRQWARGLRALGVRRGEAVLVWLPNGAAILQTWFAAAHLGAVYAPINVAYRGELLEHVIRVSGARIMVAHAALLPRLSGLSLGAIEAVISIGEMPQVSLPVPIHDAHILDVTEGPVDDEWPQVMPWETHAIIYTSGTTGPLRTALSS